MFQNLFRSLLIVTACFAVLTTTACPDPVCLAGASAACACPNGAEGAQVCRDDGAGFDACVCTSEPEAEPEPSVEPDDDAGPVEPDAEPDVEPDAGPNAGTDAGEQTDAGPVDAGVVERDGGNLVDDAGNNDDGGQNDDAGNDVDAGSVDGGLVGNDGGPVDVDAGVDGGVDAGAPVCLAPRPPGELGGNCIGGDTCTDGASSCFTEFVPIVGLSTLGSLFGLLSGTADAFNPGEFIAGPPSDVVIETNPGGLCSEPCEFNTNACGECAACSSRIGPAPFATVGITPSVFYGIGDNGICRPLCEYDATLATNGGCDDGYTCSKLDGVCVEACASDAQCNLRFGFSREEGLVAGNGSGWTCDDVSGQCVHAENGSVQGDACNEDVECPQSGRCFGGTCATVACGSPDGTIGPVPCDDVCVAVGPGTSTLCLPGCEVGNDCPTRQACSLFADGASGICVSACDANSECGNTERCRAGVGALPDAVGFGACSPVCDADSLDGIAVPGAVACGLAATCVGVDDEAFGFCEPLDGLCRDNAACVGPQACEVLGNNLFGRCVDGCGSDSECDASASETCVFNGEPIGICRRPGGDCAQSPDLGNGPQQPLLGDAQCILGEVCSSPSPRQLGNCVE